MICTGALWAMAMALLCTSVSSAAGPAQAVIARDGSVRLARGSTTICQIDAGLYDDQWRSAAATADTERSLELPALRLRLMTPGRQAIRAVATIIEETGQLRADYRFTPETDVVLNSLNVAAEFTVASLAGGAGRPTIARERFPATFSWRRGSLQRLGAQAASRHCGGPSFGIWLSGTHQCVDSRQSAVGAYVLRAHPEVIHGGRALPQGCRNTAEFCAVGRRRYRGGTRCTGNDCGRRRVDSARSATGYRAGIRAGFLTPVAAWSAGGQTWMVTARDDGTFRFEQRPDQPARFYGVNLCFSSQYLTHPQSDQLAERLVRLGYNTVRLHHYESELTENTPDRTRLNPQKLDQLDYLFAALTKRGIYVTTDLYVLRPCVSSRCCPVLRQRGATA